VPGVAPSDRTPLLSLVLLLALGLLGQLAAVPSPAEPPAGVAERTTALSAVENDRGVAARETGAETLICAAAARWAPSDGPPIASTERSSVLRGPCGPSSAAEEAERSPSVTLRHLRTNGSADAHGARA
jgi:hypothetical protein